MGTFYAQYPASASAGANPSVGPTGTTAPGEATEIAGVTTGGILVPVSVDSTGAVNVNITSEPGAPFHVIVDSSALPTGAATSANQTTEITALNTIATNTTGSATAANQTTEIARLTSLNNRIAGSLTPVAYDEIDLTYVPSGNGAGQIQTAVFKLATVTVKTLTLTYDASNRLSTVVAS